MCLTLFFKASFACFCHIIWDVDPQKCTVSCFVMFQHFPRVLAKLAGRQKLHSRSVVAERVRKRGYKTSISWSGDDFPRRMRSLHLEGLCFSMPGGPELDVDIFESFLSKAVNVVAIYLDMDSEWWETWGCKFELGILDWIKSRPRMIRFDMKTLNNSLQAQIQALLLDQRRRRIRRSRR